MRKFENQVQYLKYRIMKELVKSEMKDDLVKDLLQIPKKIISGPKPESRCCIYKERAIVNERIKHALYEYEENVINVIDIACDECPVNRFSVTEACRGCIAHYCKEGCPVGAIEIINHKAHIDQSKCIECGKCKNACPYNAISDVRRPCITSCKVGALSFDQDSKKAIIDNEKCIQCGECVYKCPFGAIVDKSYILDVVRMIKKSNNNKKFKVYCIVAPAIASQFTNVKIEQIIEAIKKVGFHEAVEAAIGADIIAYHESKLLEEELKHKKFVTSSCCPAFVAYIKTKYPELTDNISPAVSPMIATARLIKYNDPNSKVVFVGPCTAKKDEARKEEYKNDVDFVISFEELQALLDANEIDIEKCEGKPLNNASYYGRIFARSGGVTEAIKNVIDTEKLDLEIKPIICDGIDEIDKTLKLAKFGKLKGNFIEGMMCKGGCINGPVSLTHKPKNKNDINKYGDEAKEKTIHQSLRVYDIDKLKLS